MMAEAKNTKNQNLNDIGWIFIDGEKDLHTV